MVLVSILSTPMQSLPSSPTPQSFKFLKTPHNRQDLCQQTLNSIAFIHSNSTSSTDTSITLFYRLAHKNEAAMTKANIESIEKHGAGGLKPVCRSAILAGGFCTHSVYSRLTGRVRYLAICNTEFRCTKATVGYAARPHEIEHNTLLSLCP